MRRWFRPAPLALAAITGLALALRAGGLGAPSITHDEAYGLWVATRPLAEVLPATVHDVHPPLYYLLLHGWLALGPPGDTWARLPSALAGTALVPVMYALGCRLWDRQAGLVAALLAALSPLAVAQAREARMYPLAVLLLALAACALLRASPQPRRWWITYVMLMALALYTHYYVVFILVAFFIYCILRQSVVHNTEHGTCNTLHVSRFTFCVSRFTFYACPLPLASCLLPLASCLLLYLPWLPALADQVGRVRAGFWVPPPSPESLGRVAQTLAFYAVTPRPATATLEDLLVKVVGAVCVVAALFVACIASARRRLLLPVLWLAVPVTLAYAVSLVGPSVFEPRYFAVCLPACWLLLARGATALPGRILRAGMLTGLTLAALASLVTLFTYAAYRPPDARAAAAWLRERAAPRALIVHTSQFSLRPVVWYNGAGAAGVLADDPALPAQLAAAGRVRLVVHYDVRVADGPRQADTVAATWAAEHKLWNLRTVARFWGIHIYEWAN